jgi:phosphoglycerol transferase MdoB-like AlkP superfamily enzyme
MAERLKAAKKPTFLYWLTLNSHLPVPPGLNLDVDHCERVSPKLAIAFPQICRQFTIYNDIDVAMVKEITASDFPNSDILLVGDHMPPYFDRHHRTQYDAENVPWLYLRSKQ